METVIGKKMKFRARDPLSALTHFIGFLAVIPPVICLLERSETTAQVVSFGIFGISLLLLYGSMGDCNFRHFYENLLDECTALALYADLCRHGLACGCGVYSVEKSHRLGRTGDASGRRHCVYHRCGDLCAEKTQSRDSEKLRLP